jgi:hypothetical protein
MLKNKFNIQRNEVINMPVPQLENNAARSALRDSGLILAFIVLFAIPVQVNAAQVTCSNSTMVGTVVGTSVAQDSNLNHSSYVFVEYWDGKGNSWLDEFDSTGLYVSGWYSQKNTYNVSRNCVALDYYQPNFGYLYFVNPDGTGLTWTNGEYPTLSNSRNALIDQGAATKVSGAALPTGVIVKPACQLRSLLGTYITTAFEYANGLAYSRMSRRSFDGKGGFSYREDLVTPGAIPTRQSGSGVYTVSGSCRVALFYDAMISPSYVGVSSPDGNYLWWINSQALGAVSAGKAQRISLSSVDNSSSIP